MEARTAADGTILSYEVDICIPGKGSYRSTRHWRFMRKYNVPLMAESDDTKVDDSLVPDTADTRMNDSVPNSSIETADRRITRSWKKNMISYLNQKYKMKSLVTQRLLSQQRAIHTEKCGEGTMG